MREGEGLQEGGRGGSALAGALWWLLWRMTGWESGPALPCLGAPLPCLGARALPCLGARTLACRRMGGEGLGSVLGSCKKAPVLKGYSVSDSWGN